MVVLIIASAFLASMLTLFSGFGLGTLLMPIVALFFPVEVAIGITAIVHLANNAFKLVLVGRSVSVRVVLRFGIPAVVFSFLGAFILARLGGIQALYSIELLGVSREVSAVKAVAGTLILLFVALESLPAFKGMAFGEAFLPVGGALSGFFGGLSGHQGALRSMFLVKAGLSKEEFIASGVVIAVLVDLARIVVYGTEWVSTGIPEPGLVAAATAAAFLGAFVGATFLTKVTFRVVQGAVSVLLAAVAMSLLLGV